jgi:release factor glutamine methyltransferase
MAQSNEPWTVLRLLNWTKEYFARQGVDSPRLATEMLLSHVLGCSRIELYARFNHEPTPEQLTAFREMVRRGSAHEPVAYLVGSKEFYSLPLKVTPDVLIPRPETEIVVDQAVAYLKDLGRAGLVWDVCTGSGCVAVAVARNAPKAKVLATDVSEAAVAVAAGNAEANGVAGRVVCRVADMLALPEDIGELDVSVGFDVITANPPYVADADRVAECVKHEPRVALFSGPEGLEMMRRLIDQAPERLRTGGWLITEFGMEQADDVRDLLSDNGAFAEPEILTDQQDLERVAVAERL